MVTASMVPLIPSEALPWIAGAMMTAGLLLALWSYLRFRAHGCPGPRDMRGRNLGTAEERRRRAAEEERVRVTRITRREGRAGAGVGGLR